MTYAKPHSNLGCLMTQISIVGTNLVIIGLILASIKKKK